VPPGLATAHQPPGFCRGRGVDGSAVAGFDRGAFILLPQLHYPSKSAKNPHWKHYAAIRDANYVTALYNRLGYVDITALIGKVAADIEIAKGWKPGSLQDRGKRAGAEKGFRK
jgi:hypothetical protein